MANWWVLYARENGLKLRENVLNLCVPTNTDFVNFWEGQQKWVGKIGDQKMFADC
jgi:hypothetical protein